MHDRILWDTLLQSYPLKPKNVPISMKFGLQVDIGVASSFPISKFYPVVAIFYSKWPPKPKNAPISMKFGFQVNIGVASSFPVNFIPWRQFAGFGDMM